MGELLPPALRGRGGREAVSGGLQLPPDILAGPARLHRPGTGTRQAGSARELQDQCSNLGPHPVPKRGGASIPKVLCCVCRVACERAPRLASRSWDTEALPVCSRHGYAYAPGSLGPSQCLWTQLTPARWPARPPCLLRSRGRVRTGCAPPAAPQRPDHTHVTAQPRARKPT